MHRFRLGLLALSALLAVGAGYTVTTQTASAQASTRLVLTLSEFAIQAERPAVPAGDVTFDLVNTGEDTHEVIVIKSDQDITKLPPSAVKGEVDEAAVGEYIGGWEDIPSAGLASGTLSLAPGRYILLCNLTKHYEQGMVATLLVE